MDWRRLVGDLEWKAPPWVIPRVRRTRISRRLFMRCVRTRARARGARRSDVIILLCILATAYGVRIWQNRPAIPKVTATVHAPGPKALVAGARPKDLRVSFDRAAARLDLVGEELKADSGASIDPPIAGQWRWASERELVFRPDASTNWGVGRRYRVRLREGLFTEGIRPRAFSLPFKSADFQISLTEASFVVDARNPMEKRVSATFSFSHPVDRESFESRIAMLLEEKGKIIRKRFPYKVLYDSFGGKAFVVSEPVRIPLSSRRMAIILESGVRASGGGQKGVRKITGVDIPGMYSYFRIAHFETSLVRNAEDEPEQVLIVSATDGFSRDKFLKRFEAWILPVDKPAAAGGKAVLNYHWPSPSEVGPEVIALSKRLSLTPLAANRPNPSLHSFRFKATPGRRIFVRVRKGLVSSGGYVLAKSADSILSAPSFPRELRFLGDGALLSLTGGKNVPIVSRGVGGVRFEIGRILGDQVHHLVSQSRGRFQSPVFNDWRFGPDNLTERIDETRRLDSNPRHTQYTALALGPKLISGKLGLFFLRARSWDVLHNRPTGIEDKRLVLLTDLGLLVKEAADGSRTVFVQSLSRGGPVAGVVVSVLGKNGLSVAEAVTGAEGRVQFTSLSGLDRGRQPVVIIAKKNGDFSFIPFDRQDRRLDLSQFDIGGRTDATDPKALRAYLFSDRGLYRPGEKIRAGLIVKDPHWRRDLNGMPIEWRAVDPRGRTVVKQRIRLSRSGFEEIAFKTSETDPTGGWRIDVHLIERDRPGRRLASRTVRVEEFIPDRTVVQAGFSPAADPRGWRSPKGLGGWASLRTLYGTAAESRTVRAEISMRAVEPRFSSWPGYRFSVPRGPDGEKDPPPVNERLDESVTDSNGRTSIALMLNRFDGALFRLRFRVEGLEPGGGRAVAAEKSALVSDLPFLVGWKSDGPLGYLHRGSSYSVNAVAVGPHLSTVTAVGLSVCISQRRSVATLVRRENGTYAYRTMEKENLVSSRPFSFASGPVALSLPTRAAGDFSLSILDAKGRVVMHVPYTVAGAGNRTGTIDRKSELRLILANSDVKPGGIIEMQITAPYAGAGLITVERDRVYAHRWFRSKTASTVQRIKIPEGIEGNAYIHVAFVRALDSDEVFRSPLSYAVKPISISRDRRTSRVTLETRDSVRPGETLRVRVKADRPGRTIVFAVDEGILRAAGYKTPNPLSEFLAKRALTLRTSQILDQLLPEFDRVIERAGKQPGGDGWDAVGKNLNPFRRRREAPVVFWSGLLESTTGYRTVAIPVPDHFDGTMKIMAVHVAPDAVGVAEERTLVRGPFVVSPNTPLFAAPGDLFEVSAAVHNAAVGSGPDAKIRLSVEPSEHLSLEGISDIVMPIPEGSERVAKFRVRARERLGGASLRVVARWGNEIATRTATLSIRPLVPYRTTVTGGNAHAGLLFNGSVNIETPRAMYSEFRVNEASLSPLPLGLAHGLDAYLHSYPYLCTEQLVSRAFPSLILRKRPAFGYKPDAVRKNLKSAFGILRSRQNGEGAFGFWAANSHAAPFHSVYAAHFLIEARDAGVAIPEDVFSRVRGYLDSMSHESGGALSKFRERAYALYVLTRSGILTTGRLRRLHADLKARKFKGWRKDLTAAYLASSFKLLRLDDEADSLVRGLKIGSRVDADYEWFYDGLRRDAQLLYLFSTHFPARARKVDASELEAIAKPIHSGSFNTVTAVYAMLAFDAYASLSGTVNSEKTEIVERLVGGGERALTLSKGLFSKTKFSPEAVSLELTHRSRLPLFYQAVQAGYDREIPKQAVRDGIEIIRELLNEEGKETTTLKRGASGFVRLRLRSTDGKRHSNVAVVDLLPAGLEASRDGAGNKSSWNPQWTDFREDRVLLFGIVEREVREYRYPVRAVSIGSFGSPPPYAESMYDRRVRARGLGATVEVVP